MPLSLFPRYSIIQAKSTFPDSLIQFPLFLWLILFCPGTFATFIYFETHRQNRIPLFNRKTFGQQPTKKRFFFKGKRKRLTYALIIGLCILTFLLTMFIGGLFRRREVTTEAINCYGSFGKITETTSVTAVDAVEINFHRSYSARSYGPWYVEYSLLCKDGLRYDFSCEPDELFALDAFFGVYPKTILDPEHTEDFIEEYELSEAKANEVRRILSP